MKKIYKKAVVVLTTVFSLISCSNVLAEEKVLLEKDSLYNRIKVVDDGRFRSLYCGNGHQSMMDLKNPDRLVFSYTKSMMASLSFLDKEPKSVLLIGGGGASIPKLFQKHFPNVKVDVVELDGEVNKAAIKYFNFKPSDKVKTHVIDGRMFVKQAKIKYDVIMLDAFRGGYIPFHLLTKEFLTEVKGILNPGGIVIGNTFLSSKLYNKETNTYFSVYKNVYEMIAGGNRIIIADNNTPPVTKEKAYKKAQQLDAKYDLLGVNLAQIVGRQYRKLNKISNETILTDDFAPTELLGEE